jgi:hypothetical protein
MQGSLKNLTEALKKFDARELSLAEVVKEFVLFFEQMNGQAEKVPADKREEFTNRFIEATQKLVVLIRPYMDAIQLSEEKLISTLENPDFFDPDDWKAVYEAKERLAEIATALLPHLSTLPKLSEPLEKESLKKGKTPVHTPRSKWMKS